MTDQIKYVLRGVLSIAAVLIIFSAVKFITGIRFFEPPATTADIQNNALPEKVLSSRGQQLFGEDCASCHEVNKTAVGPALYDFAKRGSWKDKNQLYSWIHNPSGYVKHSAYAQGLYKQYNEVMMTAFPELSDGDIEAIADYIQSRQNVVSLPIQ